MTWTIFLCYGHLLYAKGYLKDRLISFYKRFEFDTTYSPNGLEIPICNFKSTRTFSELMKTIFSLWKYYIECISFCRSETNGYKIVKRMYRIRYFSENYHEKFKALEETIYNFPIMRKSHLSINNENCVGNWKNHFPEAPTLIWVVRCNLELLCRCKGNGSLYVADSEDIY